MKEYFEAGRIRNTHGVKGAVKIEHWCDDAETFMDLPCVYTAHGELYKAHRLLSASPMGEVIVARLEGLETMEDAAKLKNSVIYARREDLPEYEDRVFIADIIGLPVIDANTGKKYGILADVITGRAQELYVVATPDGERLMPAVNEFISEIKPEEAILVTPIPGIFD